MDGAKARLSDSLQFQLSAWLTGVVVVLTLGAGYVPFRSSFREANALQDDQLRQVAALVQLQGLPGSLRATGARPAALEPDLYIAVQVLGQAVEGTKGLDQQKIADYIRTNEFSTVVGKIKFGKNG